jgi:histidyl-tRNA synthetase
LDVLPEEAARRDHLIAVAADILGGAGYRHIETPMFEGTELFKRGVGGSTDIVRKEMYTFEDNGGREMTLRPEGTASVARSYIEHGMHKLTQPVKLWYVGPFFRYERAQAGRQRQFAQIGLEALGSEAPAVDAEAIALLDRLLRTVGCQGLRLRLGSLGSLEARAGYRLQLQDYLRAHADLLSDDVLSRIDENPLRAFDSDHPGTQQVMETAPRLLDYLKANAPEDMAHFDEVLGLLDAVGVPYEIDPTLVRGLDYYTRTVFEFTSDALGAQSGVGGGGRYDGLIEQLGGPTTPGCGWATGIERILLAAGERLPAAERPLDCFVVAQESPEARRLAFAFADEIRKHGMRAEIDLNGRSEKAQLKAASKSGARVRVLARADGITVLNRRGIEEQGLPIEVTISATLQGAGASSVPLDDALELLRQHLVAVAAQSEEPSDPTPEGAQAA